MNLKKLLCSFLAIVMVLSTMSISVLAEEVSTIKINGTEYDTLADALEAATDGQTIVLDSPNTAIDAKGVVTGGKTVTITGTAKFNWECGGFLFVGRGSEGDGKLIFNNATITTDNTSGNAAYGLYVSTTSFENGADVTTKNFGIVEIINNSDIQLSYLRNQNAVTVDNSKLTVYGGFSVAGRDGIETATGEDSTATMTIQNNSEVIVENSNGMGIGYTDDSSDEKEGLGVLNLENSSFVCKAGTMVGAEGTFNISGDVTVNIPSGTVNATGDVNFKGENSVGLLPIEKHTFTIEEGASLAINTYRPVFGKGATVIVKGNIADAKNADTTNMTPSLYIKGASITGSGIDFHAENAYIVFGDGGATTSKNSGAYGTFDFDFDNCVVDFEHTFAFYLPTNNLAPEFNFNLTNSKINASKFLQFSASGCNTVIDNSIVNVASQFENRGNFTIQNGSIVTVASVQTSSNANQPGTLTVDNSTFGVTDPSVYYGRGQLDTNVYTDMTGKLILKNGAKASVNGSIKDVFVTVDTSSTLATGSITGESTVTIDASNITAGKNKVLDLSETESREGKVTISPELIASGQDVIYGDDGDVTVDMYVAKIDDETYTTLQSALNAIKDTDGKTIYLYGTIEEGHVKLPTPFKNLTIDGNPTGARTTGAVVKNTQITDTQGNNFVYDGLTVKNITFDNSNFLLAGRNAGNVYGDLVFDNNRFINFYNTSSLAPVHMNLGADSTFKSFTFKNNLVENVSGSSNNAIAIKQVEGKTIIENNTFKNIPNNAVQVFYSNGIELTKNTISETGGALVNLNGTTGDISFTENTMSKNRAGQKFVTYLADGKGVSLSDNKWYDENGNQLSSFGDFEAMYDGLYYLDFDQVLEIANAGDTVYLPEGKYLVPAAAGENQATIVFDFNGGQNADGFVSETFNLNLGQAINAPAGIVKDGFIFRGWDKEVPANAYANETYTAVWVSEEDYGFKTVLTLVGGTKVSGENAIKIDPKGSFLIEVSIEDLHGDAPWNVAEVTMDYDSKLFTWNQNSSSVEAVDENTLRFKVYGADKVDGKVVKQLSFTAKSDTPDDYSGAFKVTEATVDTGWAANTIDATPAEAGEATVYIFYSFNVALGDGLSGAPTATTDKDYTGQIVGYDDEYNYVMTGTSGKNPLTITFDNTGKFTVTKDQIVGDMVISVEKTGLKGITADDVELYEYVADKYVLVLLNADKDRVYTYNGSLMYLTPHYDTVAGEKVHYGYLVKGTDFTADAAGSLNTEENKALALAKIGRHKTAAANLSLGNAEVGDVNNTGKLDVNDIQAVWNCYNVEEGNDGVSVNVNMPLYLRSDICGHNTGGRDKKVDSADVNAVRAMYDCEKNGGTVTVTDAVLAQCGVEGATYAITLHNADGTTVELVKSTTGISATNDPTAEGHNYAEAHFDSANKLYVETCTVCGGKIETPITETSVAELFSEPKINGNGKIYGTANVSTAEDLLFINTLDEKGALAHGEGQRTIIDLNDDIDLDGQTWRPLNGHWVTINGNNNTLSNFTVEGAQAGLVSYAGACIISDLTLKDITVTGGQAGAFLGNGEGGSVKNCRLEGTININWKKYYDSAAVGIVAGLHYGNGEYSVTIAEDAAIKVSAEGFETVLGEKGWTTEKAPYIGYVTKTDNLICTFTDNRPNV